MQSSKNKCVSKELFGEHILSTIYWHLSKKIPISWNIYIDGKTHFITATFITTESRTQSENYCAFSLGYYFFNKLSC